MPENGPSRPGLDAFHRERSKCVDAFADLEAAVISVLTRHDVKSGNEPFSQKLGKIMKLQPSAAPAKADVSRLQQIAERCKELNEIRNDIVHARLRLAVIDDEHKACFINHGQANTHFQAGRLFSLQSLRELTRTILALADELSGILK